MFGNALKIFDEDENNISGSKFGTKKIAHFIAGRISHTMVTDDTDSNTIKLGTIISGVNKKVILTGNKAKIKNQLALEVLLEDGKWVSCYIDSKKIIKIPNTPDIASRLGDINFVNGKEVINIITDKGGLICVFTNNLNPVGITGYNKGGEHKKVTHIFKCRN